MNYCKTAAVAVAFAVMAGCTTSKSEFVCKASNNVTLLKGSILLDVRTQKEFDVKHLEGSVLLPHDQVAEKISSVVPDKNSFIYLYCGSGRRAQKALKVLNGLGYRNVINLCGINAAESALKK